MLQERNPIKYLLIVCSAVFLISLGSLLVFRTSDLGPLEQFVRVTRDEAKALSSLDVAVATYKAENGARVSLVSAVHLADADHYDELNVLFETYDVVLFELIAEPGMRPIKGVQAKSALSSIQAFLADTLDAEFQLEQIDYSPTNFEHADVSPSELAAEMRKRGDTPIGLLFKVLGDIFRASAAMQNDPELRAIQNVSLNTMLLNPIAFRRAMAVALASSKLDKTVPGMTALLPYLIDIRNDAAIEKLKDALPKHKTIAIYYGAAHMPDFEQDLIRDFGMKRIETNWLRAWDLQRPIPPANPFKLLADLL